MYHFSMLIRVKCMIRVSRCMVTISRVGLGFFSMEYVCLIL
jgi:hypothetical protein